MKYDKIINLPHYEPKNHPRMSIEKRSYEFAPFSALSGFKEAIIESSKELEDRKILLNDYRNILDNKFDMIKKNLDKEVVITFYENDSLKNKGQYLQVTSKIRKIDSLKRYLVLENNKKIFFDDILQIDCYDICLSFGKI